MARQKRSITASGAFSTTALLLNTLVDACKAIVYHRRKGQEERNIRAFVNAYNAMPDMDKVKDIKIDGKYMTLSELVRKTVHQIVRIVCLSREMAIILKELPAGVITDINNIIMFVVRSNDMAELTFWVGQTTETTPITLHDPTTIDTIYNHPRRDEVVSIILNATHKTVWASMYLYTFADDLAGVASVFEKCYTGNAYGTALIVELAVKLGRIGICKYIGENSNSHASSVFITAVIPSSKSVAGDELKNIDCFRALFRRTMIFTKNEALAIIRKAIISDRPDIIDVCLEEMDSNVAKTAILHVAGDDVKDHVDSIVHIIHRGYIVNKQVLKYVLENGTVDSRRKVIASRVIPYTIYVPNHVADTFMRTGVIARDVRRGLRCARGVSRDDFIDFRELQRAIVGLIISRVTWAADIVINTVV